MELGVVVGTMASNIAKADAAKYIAGYCLLNDVSERSFQLQSSQWDKGKGCDTFGPIGPWLVTADEIEDPSDLAMWLDVNGARMQSSRTSQMIFDIATLVSYVSRFMTLLPGDVIATGTPAGVGMGRKPEPKWLLPGDDLPYWHRSGDKNLLIVPYAFDTNDMRFASAPGFNTGADYFDHLRDTFDFLYRESEHTPRMMSVGLHSRLAGRPGRAQALERFFDHVARHTDVWICRRIDIARHWHKAHPCV